MKITKEPQETIEPAVEELIPESQAKSEAPKEQPQVQPQADEQKTKVEQMKEMINSAVKKDQPKPKITSLSPLKGLKSNGIAELLDKYKERIAQILPKHLTAERMIQIATTVVAQNPSLMECTASSLIGAVLQSSILGFKPVPILGYCYFVPYNRNAGTKDNPNWVKEIQFQIGYRGYIDLARRSGEIQSVQAEVVRQGDTFHYELGLNPVLRHIPNDKQRGEITHAYAVVKYKDGGYNFNVITASEIEDLRRRSPMQGAEPKGAWRTDYEAMAKAKAIKQLAKYLPLSIDVAEAIATDERTINFENIRKVSPDKAEVLIEETVAVEAEYEVKENENNG